LVETGEHLGPGTGCLSMMELEREMSIGYPATGRMVDDEMLSRAELGESLDQCSGPGHIACHEEFCRALLIEGSKTSFSDQVLCVVRDYDTRFGSRIEKRETAEVIDRRDRTVPTARHECKLSCELADQVSAGFRIIGPGEQRGQQIRDTDRIEWRSTAGAPSPKGEGTIPTPNMPPGWAPC
jgi:hypothetical protein